MRKAPPRSAMLGSETAVPVTEALPPTRRLADGGRASDGDARRGRSARASTARSGTGSSGAPVAWRIERIIPPPVRLSVLAGGR